MKKINNRYKVLVTVLFGLLAVKPTFTEGTAENIKAMAYNAVAKSITPKPGVQNITGESVSGFSCFLNKITFEQVAATILVIGVLAAGIVYYANKFSEVISNLKTEQSKLKNDIDSVNQKTKGNLTTVENLHKYRNEQIIPNIKSIKHVLTNNQCRSKNSLITETDLKQLVEKNKPPTPSSET